jgi:hypothetical protein
MPEYFNAKTARSASNDNKLNSILNLIKDATAQGKSKIMVDYIPAGSYLETKLEDMGYEMYEKWENTDPNISESQFMGLMTNWSLNRKNTPKPSFIKHTVIQW